MFLDLLILWCLIPRIHISAYSSYNYPKKNIYEKKPSFGLDDEGNAVIEIPRKYWQGKNYHSLKIHLSKKVLQNLTHGWSAEHEYEECKFLFNVFGRNSLFLPKDEDENFSEGKYSESGEENST